MKKNIAVIIVGCGFKDGTEITEAVSALICLAQKKISYTIFSPNQNFQAVSHLQTDRSLGERNTLEEAGRIARENVQDLKDLNVQDFDSVLLPGGFGVAKQLSDWAEKGSQCAVLPDLQKALEKFYSSGKPIGAICIAPAIVASVLGQHNISVTIGNDAQTANEIKKTGAEHIVCKEGDFLTDRENKILTTPAYMCDSAPDQVFLGIQKLVNELAEMS